MNYCEMEALLREQAHEIQRLEERLERLAGLFEVPDGGRYLNDWIERAERFRELRIQDAERRLPA